MIIYNSIIVGGGVSGLMAAYKLKSLGNRLLVIERGKDVFLRRKALPFDVANGIGGAGLYSDGKLSMYPSATQLWQLNETELKSSYVGIKNFLHDFSIDISDFPDMPKEPIFEDAQEIRHKCYQSILLSSEQRMGITYRMAMTIGSENILTDAEVIKIRKVDGRYEVVYVKGGQKITLITESIVLAGGKHCYSFLRETMDDISEPELFEKTEIGIRIECPNESFDYYDDEQPDVKLICQNEKEKELRTFCCSRDGIVLQSESYGYIGYNGASCEISRTGKTNIGILIMTEGEKAIKMRNDIKQLGHLQGASLPLQDFLDGNKLLISKNIDLDIRNFVNRCFPKMKGAEGIVYFPSIEKLGCYPVLTSTLKLGDENIWICGDATGRFRGLLPAFISGMLVADCLSKSIQMQEYRLLEKIHVKVSPTTTKKVIFAAQSKQSFYCRNAVCEYIFNQGCIPVNPFRIFGYFLDERVDRKLVRNGNNEMILRCDELWVFGQISDGVLFEIALCRKLGKPVRYFSISAIAKEIKELKPEELSFEPEVHKHQVKRDDLLKLVLMSKGDREKEIQLSLF